ncbi:UbiX family flavin prenyltransferase [Paraburkholderia metrosideri]|uniref:Flavin prenyltransferase UbiX n=1 Tax=Paraburkholderia metrosideri TaxID=580937 RepID=A0ABW9DPG1_9BURK
MIRDYAGDSYKTRTAVDATSGDKVTEREPRRLIVGISGASGAVYGVRALQILRECDVEAHLVVSKAAELTLKHEVGTSSVALRELAHAWYPASDIGAAISSGSFITMGMLVLPCSVRTMSEICTGVTSSLLSRAADVVLKERRRLVLGIRETPLHTGHLRTMTNLSEMGAVIAPIVPALYALPQSLEDVVDHTVGRLLDLFGIDSGLVKRWTGRL